MISGDKEAGFSIFWADDGLDTGPILLQENCQVEENDTVDSLYKRFLYPAGVVAVARAVDMVADGTAKKEPQTSKDASYDPMLNKEELQRIDWKKTGKELHNFIRGMDSVPGATCKIKLPNKESYTEVSLFGSTLWKRSKPEGTPLEIENAPDGIIHEEGLILFGSDYSMVNVKRVKINGRMKLSNSLDKCEEQVELNFTIEEVKMTESIKKVWEAILSVDIDDSTDFFVSGAGSMDVVRLVEEVKDLLKVEIANEDVFLNPDFGEFCKAVVVKSRGLSGAKVINFDGVDIKTNGLEFRVPTQLYINGKFVDSEDGKSLPCINPTDESIICHVQRATVKDVDKAVRAAKRAFDYGEWNKISARERGRLLYKYELIIFCNL